MVEVTLKAGYNEVKFVFSDMVSAAGFMSNALRNHIDENFEIVVKEAYIPDGIEIME
jgi:hypothetical protein